MARPRSLVARDFAIYQAIWAMEGLPWREAEEWGLEEQLDRIAAAGFEGIAVDDDHPQLEQLVAAAAGRGLGWYASVFPSDPADLRRSLERVLPLAPVYVNLQPNFRPASLAAARPAFEDWLATAAEMPCPLRVETHRNRATTDLFFTLELLEAFPQMELTADLSHFLVGREFAWPVPDEEQRRIDRVLDRSSALHGRVASREQVQVSIAFPQNAVWLELFLDWWANGLRRWRERGSPGGTLIFTTELGPPWYAITGPDGEELGDRWAEAQLLKERVATRWSAVPHR
jgi:hypothetical protein